MVTDELPKKAGIIRMCIRLLQYAGRRWAGLIIVIVIMLLKTGMEVLKPLPMKILLDNVLNQQPLSEITAHIVEILPGAVSRQGLLTWSAAATVLLFFLGWALGLASAYANIGFGQRMIYDLA